MEKIVVLIFILAMQIQASFADSAIRMDNLFTKMWMLSGIDDLDAGYHPDPRYVDISNQRFASVFKEMVSLNASPATIDFKQVVSEVNKARVILLTDNHMATDYQKRLKDLISEVRAEYADQNIYFVLEPFGPESQSTLDKFIKGVLNLSSEELKAALNWGGTAFGALPWEGFSEIIFKMREHQILPLALYGPSQSTYWGDLNVRDNFAYSKIKEILEVDPKARIIVLNGAYHLIGQNSLGDMLYKDYPTECIRIVTTTLWRIKTLMYMAQIPTDKEVFFKLNGPNTPNSYAMHIPSVPTYLRDMTNGFKYLLGYLRDHSHQPTFPHDNLMEELKLIIEEIKVTYKIFESEYPVGAQSEAAILHLESSVNSFVKKLKPWLNVNDPMIEAKVRPILESL